MEKKYVYLFSEGNKDMRELLGGKGANLAEMTSIGLPVPRGFTVTTEACNKYYEDKEVIDEAIKEANNTDYGHNAGVYTESFRNGLRCANEIEAGTVFVNKQSTFRTDNMPFGGFKNSGTGKEGIKYAVEEMTKSKLIGLNLR